MKNNYFTIALAILCLIFTSCDSDDDFNPTDPGVDPTNFELNGVLESDRILDPSQPYSLTGLTL